MSKLGQFLSSSEVLAEQDLSVLWDMCRLDNSPVTALLLELSQLFVGHAQGSPWWLTLAVIGHHQDEWPEHLWEQFRTQLVRAFTGAWARLLVPYQAYPWRLARIYDPRLSLSSRQACAEEFLRTSPCCLDAACGRRLREQCSSTDEVLGATDFMQHMFNGAILCTTWVETQFALMKQWLARTHRPLRTAALSCKHLLHVFKQNYKASMVSKPHMKRRQMKRPLWSRKKMRRFRTSSLHVFMSQAMRRGVSFATARVEFKNLSPEDLRSCRVEARQINHVRQQRYKEEVEAARPHNPSQQAGCWGFGDSSSFYCSELLQQDGYGEPKFIKQQTQAWIDKAGPVVPPKHLPTHDVRKLKSCSQWPLCMSSSPHRADVLQFLSLLPRVLDQALSQAGDAPFVHIRGSNSSKYVQLSCYSHKPFEAHCLMYNGPSMPGIGCLLMLRWALQGWPEVVTDKQLALACVQANPLHSLQFTILTCKKPVASDCNGFLQVRVAEMHAFHIEEQVAANHAANQAIQLARVVQQMTRSSRPEVHLEAAQPSTVQEGEQNTINNNTTLHFVNLCANWPISPNASRHIASLQGEIRKVILKYLFVVLASPNSELFFPWKLISLCLLATSM